MSLWHVTYWHEVEHGCDEVDCDEPIALDESAVAHEAVASMRRNPDVTYCKRRGCGHRAAVHATAGCLIEGCECEELKE